MDDKKYRDLADLTPAEKNCVALLVIPNVIAKFREQNENHNAMLEGIKAKITDNTLKQQISEIQADNERTNKCLVNTEQTLLGACLQLADIVSKNKKVEKNTEKDGK